SGCSAKKKIGLHTPALRQYASVVRNSIFMHKLSIVITLLVFVTSCIGNRRSNELENKYSKLIQNSNKIYSEVSNINYSTIEQRSKNLSYGDRIIDIKEISLRLKVKTRLVIDSVERYSGISKEW